MRILELELRAFGPFTGTRLDLGANEPAFHLLYGRNEAGKSTTLRAIGGLLYGIPDGRDAHLHRMPDLRIGARLCTGDGRVLELLRRKGRKDTLLALADESVVDEEVLRAALGGMDKTRFKTMFGLDHVRLREGARALLEGAGDVGESLFEASGGPGIHGILADLEGEADALFRPQGKTRELNEAIRLFKDARNRVREAAVSAGAWEAQEQAIAEARNQIAEVQDERQALESEQARLERASRVIKPLRLRGALVDERARLGDVADVPEEATEARLEAQRARDEGQRVIARIEAALERLAGKRAAIQVPESLVALPEAAVREVADKLGSHRQAAQDLPRRRAELDVVEVAAREVLRRLGRNVPLDEARALCVDTAFAARVRALAQERGELVGAAERAQGDLDGRLARRDALEVRLEAVPEPRDVAEVERALEAAQRLGDADAVVEERREEADEVGARAERALASLGHFAGTLEQAAALAVPSDETIERFARQLGGLDARGEQLTEQADEVARDAADVAERLDAEARAGEVPTEEALTAARSARDAIWGEVCEATMGGAIDPALVERFEAAVAEANRLANRLRREAERVGRHAELEARRAALATKRDAIADARAEQAKERDACAGAWGAAWREAGIAPLAPAEMRAWKTQLGRLRTLADQHASLHRSLAGAERTRDAHRDALVAALRESGVPSAQKDRSLDAVVTRARAVVAEAHDARSARAALVEELGESVDRNRGTDGAARRGRAGPRSLSRGVGRSGEGPRSGRGGPSAGGARGARRPRCPQSRAPRTGGARPPHRRDGTGCCRLRATCEHPGRDAPARRAEPAARWPRRRAGRAVPASARGSAAA